jgi:hypothetical protein
VRYDLAVDMGEYAGRGGSAFYVGMRVADLLPDSEDACLRVASWLTKQLQLRQVVVWPVFRGAPVVGNTMRSQARAALGACPLLKAAPASGNASGLVTDLVTATAVLEDACLR